MSDGMPAHPAILETYVDRTRVPAGEPAQRFALLLFHAPDAAAAAVHPPLNLSLVIDRSGSMSGAKLEYVKDAAAHALRLLHDTDLVSLVIYDDEVQVLAPTRPVTNRVRDELLLKIRGIHSGGSTDLFGGWEAGCGQVRAGVATRGPTPAGPGDFINRVLLLTDGLANVGQTDQEAIVTGVKAQRRAAVSTTTFGVGADFNQFLLQGMADNGGGHFYFIEQPSQIPAFFGRELGELLTVTARNLVLDLDVPPGVTVDLLNDLPHTLAGAGLRVELGELAAGEVRGLAFRLGLPPSAAHTELRLPLKLRYVDAAGEPVAVDGAACVFLVLPAGACEEQPVNELVLAEAGRFLGERAKVQALQRLYHDDAPAARNILHEAIAMLQKLLPVELARPLVHELEDVLRQAENLRTDRVMAKSAHYTAYLRQRSRDS